MTRHMVNQLNYTNDTSLEYRHSATRLPPPTTPHDRSYSIARSNPRADPIARQPSRPGPASHAVANSTTGTPRRRIPVACGRCRKRKIRCSGDPGDSTGCNNCKGAQVAPGLCVFLRVQCEMRELVPDHVLMMGGYEQVSSATVDLHPYSSSSSASSSASSLALAGMPHPMHSTTASQNFISTHSLRTGGGHHHHTMQNNHAMSLKSLYHQDPMVGNGSGDGNAGLLLAGNFGIAGHRTQFDGLGGDMTGGAIHGSNNGMSVSSGDMYNGNYPQYMHPDIGQGMVGSVLHGQHWTPLSGRQNPGLYLDQDQSTMQNYISTPNQPLGAYPMVFPALGSLSSSLPDGISPRTPVNEKVQLPLPIRTQGPESTNTVNLRPSSTGNSLGSDTISSAYGGQSLQSTYRGYTSWGDTFSSTSQSSGMAIPTSTPIIPSSQQTSALPVPCLVNTYGTHNNPIFPLSSSNSSLLPTPSHPIANISNSPIDSFPSQTLPHSHQKNRSNSESSSGSKATTPAQTIRTNSTSGSSYSPSYPRSSVDMNPHGTKLLQPRRTLGFNKVY